MKWVIYPYNELLKKVLTKHVWSNLCAVYVLGGNPKPINRIMSMGHASDNTRMAGLVPKLILRAVYYSDNFTPTAHIHITVTEVF